MKRGKKGAISFEQIVMFILAIVVLVLIVSYFTGTFKRLQTPVNFTIGEVEKGIECVRACSDKAGGLTKYVELGCQALTGKDFPNCG